jgi:hypothetical protein
MNLAPIIFATLVMSAFAAMPLKPDDALTGLLDEEPAALNNTKPAPKTDIVKTLMKKKKNVPKASLIDAFLDTKSKAGCVDCTGRERASIESDTTGNDNGVSQEGMSFCYRKDGDLDDDPNACNSYWGGSVDNPTYGTEYYACELGVKAKTGRDGCINGPECCLDSDGGFVAPTPAPTPAPVEPTPAPVPGTVRLTSYPRGRLQVLNDGQWRDVCSGQWFSDNDNGAIAACQQLGYTSGSFPSGANVHADNNVFTEGAVYVGRCKAGEVPPFCTEGCEATAETCLPTGGCCVGGACARNSFACGDCGPGSTSSREIECTS